MDALNLTPAIAEIFLAGAATLLVLLAAFVEPEVQASRLMRKISIGALVVTGALTVSYGSVPGMAFGNLFMSSPFTVYMKLLVLAGASVVLLISRPHLTADPRPLPSAGVRACAPARWWWPRLRPW